MRSGPRRTINLESARHYSASESRPDPDPDDEKNSLPGFLFGLQTLLSWGLGGNLLKCTNFLTSNKSQGDVRTNLVVSSGAHKSAPLLHKSSTYL